MIEITTNNLSDISSVKSSIEFKKLTPDSTYSYHIIYFSAMEIIWIIENKNFTTRNGKFVI